MLGLSCCSGDLRCCMQTLSWGMWDLVPWPGIKPGPPALQAWSLSHWTTREVPKMYSFTVVEARSLKSVPLGWNQGVGRAVLPLESLEEIAPASCRSGGSWRSLACGRITPVSASVLTRSPPPSVWRPPLSPLTGTLVMAFTLPPADNPG